MGLGNAKRCKLIGLFHSRTVSHAKRGDHEQAHNDYRADLLS
jgi:hypothetical protein